MRERLPDATLDTPGPSWALVWAVLSALLWLFLLGLLYAAGAAL